MTPTLIDTIFVVAVFVAIMFCQFMSHRNKTKHNYKNSLYWDINAMLLAVNQEWLIMDVSWYTTVMKGVLLGITSLGAIVVAISVVITLSDRLENVSDIEPCESYEDIIRREG